MRFIHTITVLHLRERRWEHRRQHVRAIIRREIISLRVECNSNELVLTR